MKDVSPHASWEDAAGALVTVVTARKCSAVLLFHVGWMRIALQLANEGAGFEPVCMVSHPERLGGRCRSAGLGSTRDYERICNTWTCPKARRADGRQPDLPYG